jgi:hypothetical protein
MASEIHVGDIGTILRVTIYDGTEIVDVSNVDSKTIYLQKPTGATLTKTAVYYTDGTDGIIQYVTEDGDLDQAGTWQIQAKIDFGTDVFNTNIEKFKVLRNLV